MRIALGIEYDGTDFFGWQRLTHGASVQGAVEKALSFVAAHPVEISCAGRTDAGVHGRCQVVHFDTEVQREPRSWILGGCSNLPASVAVLWAQPVAQDFHARFSARSRRYRYRILNRHARREVLAVSVRREDEQVIVDIEANAFLHHMVRNIVGSLLPIGRGEQPPAWMGELLAGRNRDVAGPTAPAFGLTFLGPRYEAHWGLPSEVSQSGVHSR
ncbi:tRNA pseudouridine synthase A [Dyella silvatica]|uniref:tRNA pseudouridine synthase A n=1 Tax=Dyella silvatica TaxID=2992128 RepID=UPI0022543885|nr:tRNA pseudouridine synthase A [Dyella silvatica]